MTEAKENEEWDLPEYDLENVYDEQISPLMNQIIAICKEHNMPMIASFSYKNTNRSGEESDTELCTTALLFDTVTPKTLHKAAKVIKEGWDVSPRSFAMTITSTK